MSSPPRSDDRSAAAERRREQLLLGALERRLPGAREHGRATAAYAIATAEELGLGRDECLAMREAGRLHELGKLYVRRSLLTRPESELSARARRELDSHPEAGYRLALAAGVPQHACEWIGQAGDRFDEIPDGRGPARDASRLGSRIVAAACEYDRQLQDQRRRGGDASGALIAVIEAAGKSLDPQVVDALARVLERARRRASRVSRHRSSARPAC